MEDLNSFPECIIEDIQKRSSATLSGLSAAEFGRSSRGGPWIPVMSDATCCDSSAKHLKVPLMQFYIPSQWDAVVPDSA